jgi:hypothetical protein
MPQCAWKVIILPAAALAVLFAQPYVAQINLDTTAAKQDYEKCAAAKAEQYSAGPDAADLIAKAATEACQAQMQVLAKTIDQASPSPAYMLAAMEQIEKVLITKLKLQILERRSKK